MAVFAGIGCQYRQGSRDVREDPKFIVSGFQDKFRMFRQGGIVRANNEEWELYNVINDPTELNNMAEEHPEKLEKISESYIAL